MAQSLEVSSFNRNLSASKMVNGEEEKQNGEEMGYSSVKYINVIQLRYKKFTQVQWVVFNVQHSKMFVKNINPDVKI